jgi:hypothetical protein
MHNQLPQRKTMAPEFLGDDLARTPRHLPAGDLAARVALRNHPAAAG